MRTKKWAALGAVLITATAASLAFGEDPTPCYDAYFASSFAHQQVGFHEFRGLHGDVLCAAGDPNTEEAGADPRGVRGGTQE